MRLQTFLNNVLVDDQDGLPDPPTPSDRDLLGDMIVALALLTLEEINHLRTWIRDFKTQVAASSSLADLKTRVAGLNGMSDRTREQLLNAVKNKLTDGSLDG